MVCLVTVGADNRITELYSDEANYAVPPSGAVAVTDAQGELLRHRFAGMALVNGEVVAATPTEMEISAAMTIAVQAHLDAAARALGYDNIVSACSYAGVANPYQAESQSFIVWRGAVWAYCYQVRANVLANLRTAPTEAELIAELPVRVV